MQRPQLRSLEPHHNCTSCGTNMEISSLAHVNQCDLPTFRENVTPKESCSSEMSVNFYAITRHYLAVHTSRFENNLMILATDVTAVGRIHVSICSIHPPASDPRVHLLYPSTCIGSTCRSAIPIHLHRIHVSICYFHPPA